MYPLSSTPVIISGGDRRFIHSNLALKCIANFNTVFKNLAGAHAKSCMFKLSALNVFVR